MMWGEGVCGRSLLGGERGGGYDGRVGNRNVRVLDYLFIEIEKK